LVSTGFTSAAGFVSLGGLTAYFCPKAVTEIENRTVRKIDNLGFIFNSVIY